MQQRVSSVSLLVILLVSFSLIGIIYSCTGSDSPEVDTSSEQDSKYQAFVGDQACGSCHGQEMEAWQGSHHDYAMDEATEESVRGDFGGATFIHRSDTYRFYREEDRFMVEAPGPDGETERYRITHTFGWEPLQQYLVDVGRGKLQALNIAWDTEREQWFALNPDEDVAHGDWMHWTGGAMNWNTMCADCHSTNLQQNYIPEADSFHTTWSSINVSCEACHGPGRDHVEFMQSAEGAQATIERIREDLRLGTDGPQINQINQCAQCHSLREELTDRYDHTGNFLDHYNPSLPHPPSYFADGQIKEEVYVYGSFLQSKMFREGVKCSDCHDPHSLQLKANVTDNSLCMQCHEPAYNSPDHYKHQVDTEASQCVNCHMPGRYYMEVDFRRDHSFRVPRPDLSAEFGTPNACTDCHDNKSPEWAARAVEEWYGPSRPSHFSEVLVRADSLGAEALPRLEQLIADTSQSDIVRAMAVWQLGQLSTPTDRDLLAKLRNHESGLIRKTAVRVLAGLPEDERKPLLEEVLEDTLRVVRLAAAEGLAGFSVADIPFHNKQDFKDAMQEYRRQLDVSQYFPQGQMNRGQFFERQGQFDKAVAAYRQALEIDPQFNPARMNLAYLQNQLGNNGETQRLLETVTEQEPSYGEAWYSLGLVMAEQNQLNEAIPHFEQAAKLMPDHARVRYNLAIAHQTQNKPDVAEKWYRQAIELEPDNPDFRYGICTLYLQQNEPDQALPHARVLVELHPDNSRFRELLRMIEKRGL